MIKFRLIQWLCIDSISFFLFFSGITAAIQVSVVFLKAIPQKQMTSCSRIQLRREKKTGDEQRASGLPGWIKHLDPAQSLTVSRENKEREGGRGRARRRRGKGRAGVGKGKEEWERERQRE